MKRASPYPFPDRHFAKDVCAEPQCQVRLWDEASRTTGTCHACRMRADPDVVKYSPVIVTAYALTSQQPAFDSTSACVEWHKMNATVKPPDTLYATRALADEAAAKATAASRKQHDDAWDPPKHGPYIYNSYRILVQVIGDDVYLLNPPVGKAKFISS